MPDFRPDFLAFLDIRLVFRNTFLVSDISDSCWLFKLLKVKLKLTDNYTKPTMENSDPKGSTKLQSKRSPKRQPVKFKVKFSPKRQPKQVFNPFNIDLSSNVQKILGTDS